MTKSKLQSVHIERHEIIMLAVFCQMQLVNPDSGPPKEDLGENLLRFSRGTAHLTCSSDGFNMMHTACELGEPELIEWLVKCGMSVHETDDNANAPMHFAANKGKAKALEKLLQLGADLEVRDMNDSTPLMRACGVASPAAAEFLMAKGASLVATNRQKKTPLHFAVGNDSVDAEKTMDLLLAAGAQVNSTPSGLESVLGYAAKLGSVGMFVKLLDVGAELEHENVDKQTPIFRTVRASKIPQTLLLLSRGANLEHVDKNNETVWDKARKTGHKEWHETIFSWQQANKAAKAIDDLMGSQGLARKAAAHG
jgi:Ankyrin repeats (3 copies)